MTEAHPPAQIDLSPAYPGRAAWGTAGALRMRGNLVFRHAVEKLAQTAHTALDRAGLTPADVDWLVPHQANQRIIAATAQKMQLPMDRVVLTVADHGNTSAASIPLALASADDTGSFKPGDVLVMEAIGGGMAGVAVNVWTANTDEQLRKAVEIGADTITTDDPGRALLVLRGQG